MAAAVAAAVASAKSDPTLTTTKKKKKTTMTAAAAAMTATTTTRNFEDFAQILCYTVNSVQCTFVLYADESNNLRVDHVPRRPTHAHYDREEDTGGADD